MNRPLPDADLSVRPADIKRAGAWLARNGLADTKPTPLLATRLMARERGRMAYALMLGTLFIAVGLGQVYNRYNTLLDGFEPHRWIPPVVLAALVIGLLCARARLDRWVRRVDRRAAATLPRRATHTVQPTWRAVLGWRYAAFGIAAFAGTTAVAAGAALAGRDSAGRYEAVIVLIGLVGMTVGNALQLRHLLARPVVAEDEVSLTADVIMRVEDARELAAPILWNLPVVLLCSIGYGWWTAASFVIVILGAITLVMIHATSPSIGTVARQAMGAR